MKPGSLRTAAGAWALAVLCCGGALAADSKPAVKVMKAAPAFSAAQLNQLPRQGWLTNGGNLANQRYSPLTAINRDNVAGLKALWRGSLGGSGMGAQHSGQSQPIVYEGVLFISTGANDVFALDLDTGATLWSYKANLDPKNVIVCCGWVSRGVGLGEGKVFAGQLDGKLLALDQKTGKVIWSIQAEKPQEGFAIASAPLYYNGMVITGFAGGDMGARGRVKAYNAKDGKLRWTFFTIPAPGEYGSDTWPRNSDVWKHGGAPVWQTPAVDPELGLIYFSTGNPGPDLNGGVRAGDNLFTDSIVALDVATGKYRWHFQQVHHDIWDYDSPSPVILFDAAVNGVPRKGLVESSKSGFTYILDRVTGKPLIGIEERPVPQEPRQATAATQPHPIGESLVPQFIDAAPEGFQLTNEGRVFTPFWDKIVLYKPLAGVNWPPSAYDPETHLLYVCGNDRIGSAMVGKEDPGPPSFQGMWLGGQFGRVPTAGRGLYGAIDVTTHRIKWRQQWTDGCHTGSVVTAGGLVFVGRSDGRLTALDKANGDKLWEFQTDGGMNSTVSVFEYQGRQYVAALGAGTLFAGSKRSDGVWLFGLDGTLEQLPAPTKGPPPPAAGEQAPAAGANPIAGSPTAVGAAPAATAAISMPRGEPNIASGKELYMQTCLPCHGDKGLGGHGGGASLQAVSKDVVTIMTTVTQGRNAMPAFGTILTPEQIRDVSAFISKDLIQ